MAQSTYSDTELLTEHFGYPPVSLLDDIINSINILAERALNSVEQGLLSAPPASIGFKAPKKARPPSKTIDDDPEAEAAEAEAAEAARHEIENGTHQLETLLCASIDRDFDKFELYVLRNILCVRPEDRAWIRLSHYDGLDFSAAASAGPNDPNHPTPGSVGALRRKLQASQRLNGLLHAERARNEALLSELRAVVGSAGGQQQRDAMPNFDAGSEPSAKPLAAASDKQPSQLAFLRNRGSLTDGDAERPLTTTTAFALSQLQALRALSTSLRTMLPDLAEVAGSGDPTAEAAGSKKGWRSERVDYVESATRRHLENVRGLELGRTGEVADGEWQGEGRNVAPGEVDSLERVVAMFGGPPGSKEQDTSMDET